MNRFTATLCLFALFIMIPFSAAAERPAFCSAEEWEILKQTNERRLAEGAAPVSTFAALDGAAAVRAE